MSSTHGDLFHPIKLVSNICNVIQSMACYDNILYISTKEGRLLIYKILPLISEHDLYHIPRFDTVPSDVSTTTGIKSDEAIEVSNKIHFKTETLMTKSFKGSVTNLIAVPENKILLAIADNNVTAFDLPKCITICQVPSSQNASCFAVSLSTPRLSSETAINKNGSIILRLCVVVKKKLMFWRYDPLQKVFLNPKEAKDPIMQCWPLELNLIDSPKTVEFVSVSQIVIGYKNEYHIFDIISNQMKVIGLGGKNQNALVSLVPYCMDPLLATQDAPAHRNLCQVISDREISNDKFNEQLVFSSRPIFKHDSFLPLPAALVRDDETLIPIPPVSETEADNGYSTIFGEGNNLTIRWSSNLNGLLSIPPFVLGVMDNYLEFRTLDPNQTVQVVPLNQVSAVCHCRGWLYVASAGGLLSKDPGLSPSSGRSNFVSKSSRSNGFEIWLIMMPKRSYWVDNLAKKKEFELGMRMAEISQLSGQMPLDAHELATHFAFHLYKQSRFEKSLAMFFRLKIDPSHVLGLFPNFIPDHLKSQIIYPAKLLTCENEEIAICTDLTTYLLRWRNLLRAKITNNQATNSEISNSDVKSNIQVSLSQF